MIIEVKIQDANMKELNAFSGTCKPAPNQTVQVKIESDEVQYELLLSPSNSVAPCDIEIVSYTTSDTQWKKGMLPSMLATSLPERIVAFCHIRYASMQQRGRLIS
jgi:hypothetical protein